MVGQMWRMMAQIVVVTNAYVGLFVKPRTIPIAARTGMKSMAIRIANMVSAKSKNGFM